MEIVGITIVKSHNYRTAREISIASNSDKLLKRHWMASLLQNLEVLGEVLRSHA